MDETRRPSRLDLVRRGQVDSGPRTGRLVVALERVVEDPRNERKVFRNMEGLVASVRALGLVEPLTVTPLPDGRFQIITGHRRYRAARAAGLSEVEVLVREPEAERVRRRKSLASNIQREAIGPVELAEALQEQLEEDEALETQAELAAVIGKDRTWVSAMLRILTLPVPLRERVGTSQLSLSWESVARIARVGDARVQETLVAALLGGATHVEIREAIRHGRRRRTGNSGPASSADESSHGVDQTNGGIEAIRSREYQAPQQTTVIVRSDDKTALFPERIVAALEDALRQARLGHGSDERSPTEAPPPRA